MGRLVGVVVMGLALWTGVAVASSSEPRRYKAELDPKGFQAVRMPTGQLPGWYVYVYVGDERVICANPVVWDGPKVITCDHVVAIDAERPVTDATTSGPWAGGRK